MAEFDIARLRAATGIRHIEYCGEVGSTNDLALQLIARGDLLRPFVVLADRQSAGRGRGSNTWWSDGDSLVFSLVADTPVSSDPGAISKLSPLSALAIVESLSKFVPAGALAAKWPNDVFLNERKVCGILIERAARAAAATVIGVGINVNNRLAEAPDEIRSRATSLADVAGTTIDRQQVLADTLNGLQAWLPNYERSSFPLADHWRPYCLLSGRTVTVQRGEQQIVGKCQGIRNDGSLMVLTETGLESCISGVVQSYDLA